MRIQNHKRKPWVFKKHSNNINLFTEVALYLKANKANISIEEKEKMYTKFQETSLYNPRKSLRDEPLDSINHKLDGLNYYMFGYSDKIDEELKFIFSPLGNLYLKYLNNSEAMAKIFATMLVGMQFPHPSSRPSENFHLYPFRLIFSLLLDERLNGYLNHFEMYKYLIYVDSVTPENYESLVSQILDSRTKSDAENFAYLKEHEYEIVKSTYEWQYYVSSMLQTINVLHKNDGNKSIDLYHPSRKGSKSAPTKRKINNGWFELTKTVKPLISDLLNKYTVYDSPLKLDDSNRKSGDVVKEIYSFYPDELLADIGEVPEPMQLQLLKLPKLIEKYSQNPDNKTSDKFEDVLEDAFNMFINVEATKLSGAGRTDIECIYFTENKKFAVEAKSTANKLIGLNAGRLRRHRSLIGANYTIVVTPRYVPSVRYDILDQEIVIIKANTLSEYLYNNIVAQNREIDYGEIEEIIINNLGQDISKDISELTLSKFG